MTRWTRPLALVLIFASALGSAPARAQDDVYRRLAQSAADAVAAHRLPEALSLFREMHAMAPSARTLLNLGRVHYELGQYVVALDYIEQALPDARRPLEGDLRAEAEGLATRAHALIAEITVEVTPQGATMLLDDVVVSGPRLRLDPGEHVVRFELAGYEPSVRRIPVRGGETATLTVRLSPTAGGVPAAASLTSRDPTLEVRARRPGLSLHLQPMSTVGTPGPLGPMELACEAPCEHSVHPGAYQAAVEREDGTTASAGLLAIGSDMLVDIDYVDGTETRNIAVAITAIIAAVGVGLLVTGPFLLEQGSDIYDSGWGVATLTVGLVLTLLGIPALIGSALITDEGMVMASPR